MQPILELVIKGGDAEKVVAVACGKCRGVAHSESAAIQCCDHRCATCNGPLPRPYLVNCDACQSRKYEEEGAARLAKLLREAKRVPLAEYTCSHVCLSHGPDESDYILTDDALDRLDDAADEDEIEAASWVWGCVEMTWPKLSAEDICYQLSEEMCEDSAENLDEEGLQKLLDEWLAKQDGPACYMVDTSTIVVLPERKRTDDDE